MKKVILFFILTLSCAYINAQPDSPLLENPPKEADVAIFPLTLNWGDVAGADCYFVEITMDSTSHSVKEECTAYSSQTIIQSGTLDHNTKYYWRVKSHNAGGWGQFSHYYSFTTADVSTTVTIQNLSDGVIDLIVEEDIPAHQGNIIVNRLQNVISRINNNQHVVALVQMYIVKARILILRISGQISNNVYSSLNYSTDGVIDLINEELEGRPDLSAYNEIVQPKTYSLQQNYPNPFNPATTIEYSIPENSFVSIKIFDMLGKEITTLVSKQQETGTYVVDWNASSYSSGIYFYRITAGNFVQTKKMILSK